MRSSLTGVRGRAAQGIVMVVVCLLAALAPAAGQAQRWPSESPPRPLAAGEVRFPPYSLRTLPNGLQVVTVLHHEQPVVSLRMIVRAGGALDPKDKLGLANLAAALLTQGTTAQSASEMNEAIDFIGGAMDAGAGADLSFLDMIVMKDSFEFGLRMLSDMAQRPSFALEEIERQRQQMLSSLRVSFEDPGYIANAVFRRLVYGFHPYAWPQSGTPDTIAAITREDLVDFHGRNFVPNNSILAVVGDVTADEALQGVSKVFGDWERREVPADSFVAPPDPTRRVIVIDKPDAVQTEVRVGHIGIRRNHDDYLAVNLALRILGGEGANRLHQVLRTERGLTYGAQADMDSLRDSGDFEASTNTRSEATGEVLRLMVDEFWRLQRDRIGQRELADAKAYMTGSFPLTIETPDAIATQVLNVLFYGLPVEELQSFRERVNAVTVDDIQRVARFYLRPDRLSIVLVGNAAAFAPQLRRVGFGNFETVAMNDLDLTTVDFKRPGRRGRQADEPALVLASFTQRRQTERPTIAPGAPGVPVAPGEQAKARTLLDRVIAAKGGLATLRGVKTIVATTATEMAAPGDGPGPGFPIRAETVTYLEYPDRVRVETKLPDATLIQVFDGSRAWVKDPAGVHDVPPEMTRDLAAAVRRDTIALLLAAHAGDVQVRALPDIKDESGTLHHALELSALDLEPMVLYVDRDSGLITKQTYVAGGRVGQPLVEELFGDYRRVDGLQVAFWARVRHGGEPVLERRVTTIAINAPIDPVRFQRPAP